VDDDQLPKPDAILPGGPPSKSVFGLSEEEIYPGAPPPAARSAAVGAGTPVGARISAAAMLGWLSPILGSLTLTGLVLMIVALFAHGFHLEELHPEYALRVMEVAYPLPITLLCLGALLFFVAGIPWAHTRGLRQLKAVYLSVVGFACGGTAGAVAGAFVGGSLVGGENQLIGVFLGLIGGFWVGAILLAYIGFRWSMRFNRRYGPGAADER
jgi:hypothetical protein